MVAANKNLATRGPFEKVLSFLDTDDSFTTTSSVLTLSAFIQADHSLASDESMKKILPLFDKTYNLNSIYVYLITTVGEMITANKKLATKESIEAVLSASNKSSSSIQSVPHFPIDDVGDGVLFLLGHLRDVVPEQLHVGVELGVIQIRMQVGD